MTTPRDALAAALTIEVPAFLNVTVEPDGTRDALAQALVDDLVADGYSIVHTATMAEHFRLPPSPDPAPLDKLCVCGHRQNRHTEYGCIDCGSSEASTRQHDFKRPVHFPGYDSALAAITEGAKP